MTKEDYKYSLEYCERYAKQVVKWLKRSPPSGSTPVDTGSMRADINYKITFYSQTFNILFYIDDHLQPPDSNMLPSEYAYILDTNDYTNRTTGQPTKGWFSEPIPGLTPEIFAKKLAESMARDVEVYMLNQFNSL